MPGFKRVIIISCPGSSTNWLVRVLRLHGYPTEIDKLNGPRGCGVGFQFVPGPNDAASVAALAEFHVLHVIREPLATISSLAPIAHMQTVSEWQHTRLGLPRIHAKARDTRLRTAMRVYHAVNEFGFSTAIKTLAAENLWQEPQEITRYLPDPPRIPERQELIDLPTNLCTRKRRSNYEALEWGDLMRASSDLCEPVRRLWNRWDSIMDPTYG